MHAAALHKRTSTLQRLHRNSPRPKQRGGGGGGGWGGSRGGVQPLLFPLVDTHILTWRAHMRPRKLRTAAAVGLEQKQKVTGGRSQVISIISYGPGNKGLREILDPQRTGRPQSNVTLSQESEAKVARRLSVNSTPPPHKTPSSPQNPLLPPPMLFSEGKLKLSVKDSGVCRQRAALTLLNC